MLKLHTHTTKSRTYASLPAMPTTQRTNEFFSPLTHTHERLVLWRLMINIISYTFVIYKNMFTASFFSTACCSLLALVFWDRQIKVTKVPPYLRSRLSCRVCSGVGAKSPNQPGIKSFPSTARDDRQRAASFCIASYSLRSE